MRLLLIDVSTEEQARCARRIEAFSQGDIETLNLRVQLCAEHDYEDRLEAADVVVLGAGLGDRGVPLARAILLQQSWLQVIMYVSDDQYSGGAFRAAHAAGVRKVFKDDASPLDLLQELVGLNAEFKRAGRTNEGKVFVIAHAKGGVGATSIAAGLAEVCSVHNRKTLLWDLDVETRDLSRALTVNGAEAKVISAWVNGSRDLTRESLNDALIPISGDVSVLMPPDRLAESMDLICHTEGISVATRIAELSRLHFDALIVDTGGRLGPATGALMRLADIVVVVIDDTILGLTAVDLYLTSLKSLMGGVDKLRFLVNPYSGALQGVEQIAAELEPIHKLGPIPWSLPAMQNDHKAALWPGSGRTMYSMGQRSTRETLDAIAAELGLIGDGKGESMKGGGEREMASTEMPEPGGSGKWYSKLFR
jgi:cellulose biosynthesis protein BcsQ